jgi:hypothetical protein
MIRAETARSPCEPWFWRAGNPVTEQCTLGRPVAGSDSAVSAEWPPRSSTTRHGFAAGYQFYLHALTFR